jgi:glycogen operon protein
MFELPEVPQDEVTRWHRVIDTQMDSPDDFCDLQEAPVVDGLRYRVEAHSVVMLLADRKEI